LLFTQFWFKQQAKENILIFESRDKKKIRKSSVENKSKLIRAFRPKM